MREVLACEVKGCHTSFSAWTDLREKVSSSPGVMASQPVQHGSVAAGRLSSVELRIQDTKISVSLGVGGGKKAFYKMETASEKFLLGS